MGESSLLDWDSWVVDEGGDSTWFTGEDDLIASATMLVMDSADVSPAQMDQFI